MDLCQCIEGLKTLAPEHRAVILADVKRAFQLAPQLLHARPNGRVVGPILRRLHPIATGLSEKRLANIRASVRMALKIGYGAYPGAQHRTGLLGAWATLFATLGHRTTQQMRLSRMVHWFQHNDLAPEDVNDDQLGRYIEYLEKTATVAKPLHAARVAARHWNVAVNTIVEWPQKHLTLPSSRKTMRAPSRDQLSDGCARQFDLYVKLMREGSEGSGVAQFDLHDVDEGESDDTFDAYADTTIVQRKQLTLRAIGLLAAATGRSVATLEFSELGDPTNASRILTLYKMELGGRENAPSLLLMALALSSLARRFLKVDAGALHRFKRLVSKAARPARDAARAASGMTVTNRMRLQEIGPRQMDALFRAPAVLVGTAIHKIYKGIATTSDLVNAEVGAAIAILLHAALRGTNLVSIRFGRHLVFPPGDESQAVLRFERNETKSGQPLTFVLPLDVTRLLRRYVAEVLPHFPRSIRTNALFPGLANDTKGAGLFGSQIAARINNLVGIQMNQHLFRHFLACLYLRTHPGHYSVVQTLLGHRNVETTRKYYCGLEADSAIAHFHNVMAAGKLKAGLDPRDMSRIVGQNVRKEARKGGKGSGVF